MFGIKLAIDERDGVIKQLRLLADEYKAGYEQEKKWRIAAQEELAKLKESINGRS